MRIVCIYRSPRFSPNSVERDAAILEAVGATLSAGGHQTIYIKEDEISEELFEDADAVFSMARDTANLQRLEAWTEHCATVPNRPKALLQASRTFLTQLMAEHNVPQPKFEQVGIALPNISFPLWIKRGDFCAQEKGDVSLVQDWTELQTILTAFEERGITDVLAFSHENGDLIKFYGVAGTDFFYITYPKAVDGFSKFGLEAYNHELSHYTFSQEALHEAINTVAEASGLSVYGGDAIVHPDGSFVIIDFNDWPSFATCRDDAAKAIASLLHSEK